ncbi:hypothetical protein ACIBG4_42120 [Nonomuraea sp. NPDC050383]|uniref:hypothetical protein n=1 Tax=Nonomuraea sp. NPDC050383 TaxID=3364362 RepID=UPI0037BC0F90
MRQAEVEYEWAIASARAESLPVRAVAAEAGRSPSRIQQIATAAAPLPELEAALTQLRPADDEDAFHVGVDLDRVAAVLRRIACDIDELARARAVADLDEAAIVHQGPPVPARQADVLRVFSGAATS